MKVKFQLAGDHKALRIALPGGREIALDGSGFHLTDDPAEIAKLDAHPAAKRAPKAKAKAKAKAQKTAVAAPVVEEVPAS